MATLDNNLFDKDIEEAVIGSVLIDPGCYSLLDLEAEHFYIRRLGHVWQAFGRISSRQGEIDILTVSEELERMGKLEEVGGMAYLTAVIGCVPSSLHAEDYAGVVRDYAARRNLMEVARSIAKLAMDKQASLEEETGKVMAQLTGSLHVKQGAQHISTFTKKLYDRVMERAANPQEVWGIRTGFLDFDHITGGLHTSAILYISGDPGVGKSMFTMQCAFQAASFGCPSAIYSLEMPGDDVAERNASHLGGVPEWNLDSGHINDEQWMAFADAVAAIDRLPLYLCDAVGLTTASLRADLARLKAQYGIKLFVLDYAYLLQDKAKDEIEKTGLVSAQLKAICRQLGLAGIVIQSENKGGMEDPNQKKAHVKSGRDLRGSGQQYFDTDLLLMLQAGLNNEVIFQFGKGRRMQNSKQAFTLLKRDGFPAFLNPTHVDADALSRARMSMAVNT